MQPTLPTGNGDLRSEAPVPPPKLLDMVVDVPTSLIIPSIPVDQQCSDPPSCFHGKATLVQGVQCFIWPSGGKRTVVRRDSPNVGRTFFVCCSTQAEGAGGSCGFFRWGDELEQYSSVRLKSTMTAEDVKKETKDVDPSVLVALSHGPKFTIPHQ